MMKSTPMTFRGAPCIQLEHAGSRALVALHGAQLLSFVDAAGQERLFLGERAEFGPGKAIRGGIPVIFPQFSDRGPWRRHGFARITTWDFAGIEADTALFTLRGEATDGWPHAYALRLLVGFDPTQLHITLEVHNTGNTAFAFSAALHAYLRVSDLAAVALHGLGEHAYQDNSAHAAERPGVAGPLRFEAGVDRVYEAVEAPLVLHDGTAELRIEKRGFADFVVWNPGATGAAGIGDLATGEYRQFVCVEAGQVRHAVQLAPGARWCGSERIG
ncbi:MAG TPA: D-hexose-6-phosphate mutarotase [Rhodanobacteraceae bacterium]|nr:D-hexose-6-phosphate mutarotase [Rhodanobacteraceae bacterium]